MNNSEKVQTALAALRKRWMEMHGCEMQRECRWHGIDDDSDNLTESEQVCPIND